MKTFNGRVVKGQIQVDSSCPLPEGAHVTITVQPENQISDPEAALEQELIAEGLLSFHPTADGLADFLAYSPVEIQGQPLSQTIVEERR
jgi:hypothetical protein